VTEVGAAAMEASKTTRKAPRPDHRSRGSRCEALDYLLESWKQATSYCATACELPFASDGVPSLPAYLVSALAKPLVLNPLGSVIALSDPQLAEG
jgi:hypothetical protein